MGGAEGRRSLRDQPWRDSEHMRLGVTAHMMGVDDARDQLENESRDVLEGQPSYWARQRGVERGRQATGRAARRITLETNTTSESFVFSPGTVNYSWRKHAENISQPGSFPTWVAPS